MFGLIKNLLYLCIVKLKYINDMATTREKIEHFEHQWVKEERNWDKFKPKKKKFDPKTLKSFDKVLVHDNGDDLWRCEFFNFINNTNITFPYVGLSESYRYCIPYNDDTKHLVGTNDEAPEYYRYWED